MKVRAWRGFHWFCSWQNLDDDEKVKRADAALTDVLRRLGLLTNDRWRELSDARTGPQTYAARVLDSAEVERRRAPGHLRQALALLAAWQDDALSAAELGAITAAQRIARQAQTETRTAALARIVRRLLITQGLDQ